MLDDARVLGQNWYQQVIIDLGTNDIVAGRTSAQVLQTIDTIIGNFEHARCIHLVTVNVHMTLFGVSDVAQPAQAINAGLALRAQRRHRIDLVDWSGMVGNYLAAGQPNGPLTADSVHPTELGQQMLADAYDRVLNGCREPSGS